MWSIRHGKYSEKSIFENQPVLFLIQCCYFQEPPEMFLNLIDKKLFDNGCFIFLFLDIT